MGTSTLIVALVAASTLGASIPKQAVDKQNEVFQRLWGTSFEWKYDALPETGTVPNFRVPYSGYIYPDKGGGTANALRKYDYAFNGGRPLAVGYEQYDTTAFKKPMPRTGPLGFKWGMKMDTPNWHGHCNGWAAATIRHAEPQHSVTKNGVTFTPADIKGLLAEIYIYNDVEHLAGVDWRMNAGLFHAIVANWIGRGGHPIGMEADPSEEKWNYPFYAYSTSSKKRSANQVEVKLNLAYIKDSNGEYQESPQIKRTKYFHYTLSLNSRGEIIGGTFHSDSSIIEMLWIPLQPKQGGRKGNEPGNRYVDVSKVLAIWRASVSEEDRKKWLIIDPPAEDRVLDVTDTKRLVPLQVVAAKPSATPPVARAPEAAPEAASIPPLSTPATPRSGARETRRNVR
jgi:hypothetical protein